MSEDARRGGIWPLALIALIAGLLGTFVVLRFTRSQTPPPVPVATNPPDKTAPPPVKPPDPPTTATPAPPVPPPPPAVQQETRRKAEEAATKLAEAQKAMDAGKVDEALAAVRAARQLADTPDAEKLEKKLVEVREQQEKARREKQDAAVRELRERVEPMLDANRWDAALADVDAANDLRDHPDWVTLRRRIVEYRTTAAQSYDAGLEEAKKLRGEGRHAQARAKLAPIIRLYPERKEAQDLLVEIDRAMTTTNMVRVPGPPKGIVVKLGGQRPDEATREYAGGAFFIDKFEVTNEEYQFFVEATGHRAPHTKWWSGKRVLGGRERMPVVGVTADDAEKYAAWAGKRLPTEDEWEYAARYIDGREFPWGDRFLGGDNAYLCNSLEYGKTLLVFEPMAVGSFPNGRSALDVMDMAGNVWEWTATKVPGKDGARDLRVLKGGSYMTRGEACRPANRLVDDPEIEHYDAGFRCVRDK